MDDFKLTTRQWFRMECTRMILQAAQINGSKIRGPEIMAEVEGLETWILSAEKPNDGEYV